MDQIKVKDRHWATRGITYVSVESNKIFRGRKRPGDNLPSPLVNGLHSPHLGWCGTEWLTCPPPCSRAFPWHEVNDLQSVWSAWASQRRELGAQGDEKTTCIREDKRRRVCSGCPVCSLGHRSTGAQTQEDVSKAPICSADCTDRQCCHRSPE